MTQKGENAQEKRIILKGELCLILRRWLLGEQQTGIGVAVQDTLPLIDLRAQIVDSGDQFSVNWLENNEQFEVKPVPERRLLSLITGVANKLCFVPPFDHGMSFAEADAKKVLHQAEGFLADDADCPILIREHIPAIGFIDDGNFCYSRVAIKRPIEPEKKPVRLPYHLLGPTMLNIRSRMVDYEKTQGGFDEEFDLSKPPSLMFDRLLTAIGALVFDSEPRKEILYWHGPGDDGKTSLMSFIGSKLRKAAIINQSLPELVKDVGRSSLQGKRFVHCEEIGRGSVLESAVKSISGSEYITGKALYQQPRTFKAEVMLFMTSNEQPIIDGSRASLSRMRYVRTRSIDESDIKDKAEIRKDLEAHWPGIVECSVQAFFRYDKRVVPMQPGEMDEAVDQFFEKADAFLAQNLVYCPGFVISLADIASVRPKEVSAKAVEARLHTILPDTYDAAFLVEKKAARLPKHNKVFKAIHNVAPRQNSPLFFRCQLAGWLAKAERTSIQMPENLIALNSNPHKKRAKTHVTCNRKVWLQPVTTVTKSAFFAVCNRTFGYKYYSIITAC